MVAFDADFVEGAAGAVVELDADGVTVGDADELGAGVALGEADGAGDGAS